MNQLLELMSDSELNELQCLLQQASADAETKATQTFLGVVLLQARDVRHKKEQQ